MTRFWHRWYRSLTWLALFAMLMAFAGPLISQTQRLMDMPSGTAASMAHPMPSSVHVHGMEETGATSKPILLSAHDMAACGYCELFLHAPGLEPPGVVPAVTPPPAGFVTSATTVTTPSTPTYPRYVTRAPPGVRIPT